MPLGRYLVGRPYSRFAVVYYSDRARLRRSRFRGGLIVWRIGAYWQPDPVGSQVMRRNR